MKRSSTTTQAGEGVVAAMSIFALLGALAGYCAFNHVVAVAAAALLGAMFGLGMAGQPSRS